jgi:hypothetical protein
MRAHLRPLLPAGILASLWLALPLGAGQAPRQPAGEANPSVEPAVTLTADELGRRVERLKASAKMARSSADCQKIVETYLSIIDQVLLDLGPKEALPITVIAGDAAKVLGPWSASRVSRYGSLLTSARKEIEDVVKAREYSRKNPGNDVMVQGVLGRFDCFFLGRWETGLSELARGTHPRLSEIARQDQVGGSSVGECMALGKAWREAGEADNGPAGEAMKMRGYFWYGKALVSATAGSQADWIRKVLAEAPWRYLADMEELDVEVGWGKFCKDGTLHTEGDVKVHGMKSEKALFIHPPDAGSSRVRYQLDRNYRFLEAHVGLTDKATKVRSEISFQAIGDGKVLWTSTPFLKAGTSQACRVKVAGIEVLELRVYCKGSNYFGLAAWLDPKVVR